MKVSKILDVDVVFALFFIGLLIAGSCSIHKNENICKQAMHLRGEVISIIPHGKSRTVTLKTHVGTIQVFDVPYEQPITTELPACKNKKGEWVWVMP